MENSARGDEYPSGPYRAEAILRHVSLAIFAGILLWQLFLPGFIGIANNGDFAKVSGHLCIGPPDRGAGDFVFFVSSYVRNVESCWNSGLLSSELALAWIASALEQVAGPRDRFDIRWLGALHAAGFLIGYALWLRLLEGMPPLRWLCCNALLILILGDVAYVAYANTFYADAAALVGASIMAPSACLLIQGKTPSTWMLVVFSAAAIAFGASKAQHALPGAAATAVLFMVAKRNPILKTRLATALCAAGIAGSCAIVITQTPAWYRGQQRFDLIFFKLLPNSDQRAADAEALGLSQEDLKYSGMHSFLPNSPVLNPAWFSDFTTRTSTFAVIRFYLTHPGRTVNVLHSDLVREAWLRRPLNLSNYRREQGHPPGSRTQRFGWWSALQTSLSLRWPWQTVLWYALILGSALFMNRARTAWGPDASRLIVAVALVGMVEFCIASLGDSIETYRHLLLFHLFTDFASLLTVIYWLQPVIPAAICA
jgi:hypothetical protein